MFKNIGSYEGIAGQTRTKLVVSRQGECTDADLAFSFAFLPRGTEKKNETTQTSRLAVDSAQGQDERCSTQFVLSAYPRIVHINKRVMPLARRTHRMNFSIPTPQIFSE